MTGILALFLPLLGAISLVMFLVWYFSEDEPWESEEDRKKKDFKSV